MNLSTRSLLARAAAALLWLAPARAGDEIANRAFIPSSNNVHGEVRVIRLADGVSVQTILYSPQLRRGLFEMKKKERACWPEETLCHADSTNYLAAMDRAAQMVFAQDAGDAGSNRMHRMLIEFTLTSTHAGYALSGIELEGPPEALKINQATSFVTQTAHPYYISHAMQLMTENSFTLKPDDARALLSGAGWKQQQPPETPTSQLPVTR
jgi:hypothetical protein